MYIGEQLINPTEQRLRLSTQLGVGSVVLDNRGSELVSSRAHWDASKLIAYRKWIESFTHGLLSPTGRSWIRAPTASPAPRGRRRREVLSDFG